MNGRNIWEVSDLPSVESGVNYLVLVAPNHCASPLVDSCKIL